MRARPNFAFSVRVLQRADYKLIFEKGLAPVFGSTERLAAFLDGVEQTEKRILKLETDQEMPTGQDNLNIERKRIEKHLETAEGSVKADLLQRKDWLEERLIRRPPKSRPRGYQHCKSNSRMTLKELENEAIDKGHVKPRPHQRGEGFSKLCPPRGGQKDIVWALYKWEWKTRVAFVTIHLTGSTALTVRPAGKRVQPPARSREADQEPSAAVAGSSVEHARGAVSTSTQLEQPEYVPRKKRATDPMAWKTKQWKCIKCSRQYEANTSDKCEHCKMAFSAVGCVL